MAAIFDTPLFTGDQSIEKVLKAGLPVLLIFLEGNSPAALDERLKILARQEAGKLLIAQLNAKDNPQTMQRYQIKAVPALVTVKDGQVLSQAESIQAEDVQRHTEYLLGRGPKPSVQRVAASEASPRSSAGAAGQSGSGQPVIVTDATFEQEVMRSPIPVVVDFWAPWCGPCRMVAPTLDKLAQEWHGRVKIAKVNVDENPRVAGSYQVQSIPTMMVVKGGQIADRWAGAMPEAALRARLNTKI